MARMGRPVRPIWAWDLVWVGAARWITCGLEEVYRFTSRPVMVRGHRFWNILGLWDEALTGLRKVRQEVGALDSIGVETWGVDFELVNAQGLLRAPGYPVHVNQHALPTLRARADARWTMIHCSRSTLRMGQRATWDEAAKRFAALTATRPL